MKRSNYIIQHEDDNTILLHDIGPWDIYLTITNDAENVVNDLTQEQRRKKVAYIDSDGLLTRLLIKDGKFEAFGLGNDDVINIFFDKGLS
jgi:hypothetical protein